MLTLGIIGLALGGRWWGVLAPAGVAGLVDAIAYIRRDPVATPRRAEEVDRTLSAVAGIAAGAALVVVGVLAGTGTIDLP